MNIKSLIYELNRVLIHGDIVQVDQGLNGGRQLWLQLVVMELPAVIYCGPLEIGGASFCLGCRLDKILWFFRYF